MNAIRIQIYLKYFFDDHSSKQFHHFWYAFDPRKLSTIRDILEDIRLNYLNKQISFLTEEIDERSLIIHLDDCQLLPFTSSQILRDNDRLNLMPLTKYKLHQKSLQDSVSLNLSSSMITEPLSIVSEKQHKRQRIASVEENIPLQSTITIIPPTENVDEQPRKKKTKTKSSENQHIPSPITQPTSEPSVAQPTAELSIVEPTPQTLKETSLEPPLSVPSTNGRIRELKSKTPTWKAQSPVAKGNAQDKVHIRFDSDSDDEPLSQTQPIPEETKPAESLPHVNGSNSSVRIQYVPTLEPTPVVKKAEELKSKKKTIDLLFEMKQHKNLEEKQGKKIQQQFGRQRAQHRKRALGHLSLANFVDQAFGLDKNDLEKQVSSNGYHTTSSTPQTLPSSFNKLARLPLVAEAIDNNDKIYDLYPPVTQCPSIQTRIAFKLLELSEDFCPKMSEFKEGTVIDVNETTNELTIQLDKPLQTVFNQPSKFYAPFEDLVEEKSDTVVLPFSDLNSVRLLTTSNEDVTS